MAKLIGFEQDPEVNKPGVGMFHFDSGVSRYGADPELAAQASALKGQIDAAPDARTAENGNPFNRSMGDLRNTGARIAADPSSQFTTDHDRAAVANADRAVSDALARGPAPAPGPGPGGAPGADQPLGVQDVSNAARESVALNAATRLMQGGRYVPGSPGVDPAKMRDTGLMVPSGRTTKTEFGAPWDADQAAARIGADQAVGDAKMRQFDLQAQQEQNQLNKARAEAPLLAQAAAEQQAVLAEKENRFRAERSRFQKELDSFNKNARIDPGRYMKDSGVIGTIGMAIAQGLGAYAATMTGAPNFAMQIVQSNIDRDIAAQRDEIENGRASRSNRLARLMDDYGWDIKQAESALRIAQNQAAANQVQLFQLEAKAPQTKAAGDVMLAELQRDTLKREQELYNASLGKQEVTGSEQFVVPKAGSGPRFVENTPEQEAALLKLLPSNQGRDYDELEPRYRLEQVQKYGEHRENLASVRAAYDDLAKAYGYTVDWNRGTVVNPKTGEVVNPDESGLFGKNENIPGVGVPSLMKQPNARVREARAKAQALTGKYLSGASVAPEQQAMIESYLLGNDDASALRGLQRAIVDMSEVDRAAEARFPEEARGEYARRQQSALRERKTAGAPVRVKDY